MTLRWQKWKLPAGNSVVGNVQISTPLRSKYLNNERLLYVYLPPSYTESDTHYPVLYMHDGQNLFDETLSFTGEWQVDETLEKLSTEGIEPIVVGIPNAGDDRPNEYTHSAHPTFGGGNGANYLKFIVAEIKPLIDAQFRTRPERATTGLMGSSLGGLISLYGLLTYPQVFSFAGVLSPAFWFNQDTIFEFVEQVDFVDGAIYMDVGTNETPDNPEMSAFYENDFKKMIQILAAKGYGADRLYTFLDEGAIHHEREWAKRLPASLRFWWRSMGSEISAL